MAKEKVTGLRMSPVLDPPDLNTPVTDLTRLYAADDSDSEDGDEVRDGDTYYLLYPDEDDDGETKSSSRN